MLPVTRSKGQYAGQLEQAQSGRHGLLLPPPTVAGQGQAAQAEKGQTARLWDGGGVNSQVIQGELCAIACGLGGRIPAGGGESHTGNAGPVEGLTHRPRWGNDKGLGIALIIRRGDGQANSPGSRKVSAVEGEGVA